MAKNRKRRGENVCIDSPYKMVKKTYKYSCSSSVFRSKLSLDYDNIFDPGHFCDCTIKVNDTELKAHKNILSEKSPVFNEICAEKQKSPNQTSSE